jgi:hypothetical protein
MKWFLYFIAGVCWLAFAAAGGWFLLAYFVSRSNLQDQYPWIMLYAPTFLLAEGGADVARAVGLLFLTVFCFMLGMALCCFGLALRPEQRAEAAGSQPNR